MDTAFIKLMEAGLLYRAERLVNWSPHLRSAISDMEVTHLEVNGGQMFDVPGCERPVQFGLMTDIAYKLVDSDKEIVVSTTSTTNEYGVWDIWETTEADEVRGNIERKKHLKL